METIERSKLQDIFVANGLDSFNAYRDRLNIIGESVFVDHTLYLYLTPFSDLLMIQIKNKINEGRFICFKEEIGNSRCSSQCIECAKK